MITSLTEKQPFEVEIYRIDLLPNRRNIDALEDVNITDPQDDEILVYDNGKWVNKTVSFLVDTYAIHNETPIAINPLPSKKFQTSNAYRSDTLQVWLNGQKLHTSEIVQHSDTEFSYPIDIIVDDMIEIAYLKKA